MEIPRFQNINNLVRWFLLFFVVFSLFYSYLNVEILTSFRLAELEGDSFCEQSQDDFKFTKVIKHEKYKNTAKIMCVYQDYNKNQYLELNLKSEKWTVISREYINTKYNFYWPIYL